MSGGHAEHEERREDSEHTVDKPSPDVRAFAFAWQKARTIQEVADAFDMDKVACMAFATRLRKEFGLNLKKFPRGRPRKFSREEIEELNQLLAEILEESQRVDDEDKETWAVRELLTAMHSS